MNNMLEQITLNFEDLIRSSSNPSRLEKLRGKYLSDTTPPYALDIQSAQVDLLNCMRYVDPYKVELLLDTSKLIEQMLIERGYRHDIETHQEHRLFGSSGSGTTDKASQFPYTPNGILAGKLSVEEANKARELQRYLSGVQGHYFGIDEPFVMVTLEPLNPDGTTLRDPRMVSEKFEILEYKLTPTAPYRRE